MTDAAYTSDHPANRLGLDYRQQADALPYRGPIFDVHTHLGLDAVPTFIEAADVFGVERIWSMSQLEEVDGIRELTGGRVQFIAVPNYFAEDRSTAFTTDWVRRIAAFADKGVRMVKFWAAPRGLDFWDGMRIDHPTRIETMDLARDAGMMFMTHIADPDTWFATKYTDAAKYGSKDYQYTRLRPMLERYHDVPWLMAHMGGTPEDLDRLDDLLETYPHVSVDTSATKWMVRELSKHPRKLAEFVARHRGRVLFGTDIVANKDNIDFDLYASRFWALRTLMETAYRGPSPIVDPDLHLVDETVPEDATPPLAGAALPDALLASVYHDAADALLPLDHLATG